MMGARQGNKANGYAVGTSCTTPACCRLTQPRPDRATPKRHLCGSPPPTRRRPTRTVLAVVMPVRRAGHRGACEWPREFTALSPRRHGPTASGPMRGPPDHRDGTRRGARLRRHGRHTNWASTLASPARRLAGRARGRHDRGMTCRQVGCGATAVLSDGELAWLQLLPGAVHIVRLSSESAQLQLRCR